MRAVRSPFLHIHPRGLRLVGVAAALAGIALFMALSLSRVAQGERPETPEVDPCQAYFGPAGCSRIVW